MLLSGCIVIMLVATACGNQNITAAILGAPTAADSTTAETAAILETVIETTEVSKESLQDELLAEYGCQDGVIYVRLIANSL